MIALRAGVLRAKSVRDPLSIGFDAVKELGVTKDFQAAGVYAFPLYTTTSYRALGAGGFAIIHRFEDVYQTQGSVTKIIGGHTVKGGVEYRKYHENYFQPNTPNGSLTFSRNQTAQNPLVSSSTQGDGLASALLGFGSGGVMSIDYPTAQSAGYFGTYINDDWRVSRKLTINVGLRYDFDIPRTDRYDRLNWLDLSAPSPLADNPTLKAIFPGRLNGLMRFTDDKKRTLYDGDYNNFQPRFGFAYALNSKTSIRAAYGLFYVVSRHSVKGEVGTAFGFTDTSIPWTLDSGRTRYATMENPFPAGLAYPPGRDPISFLGRGAGTPSPKDDNPQYQQWNFSIQREIPGRGVVEVNYVGTKGTHLYFGQGDVVSDLNPLSNLYWGMGRNSLTGAVPNPFYGIITNPQATAYNTPTIQLNRLLRPYAAYIECRRLPRLAQHRELDVPRPAAEVREAVFEGPQRDRALHDLQDDQRFRPFGLGCQLHRRRLDHPGLFQPAERALALGIRRAPAAGGQLRLPAAVRPRPRVRQVDEPRTRRCHRRMGNQRNRQRDLADTARHQPVRQHALGRGASVRI